MALRKVLKVYSERDVLLAEVHRLGGRLHRNPKEGPACSYYHQETGALMEERYYWNSRLHRENGPAVVEYHHENGAVILEGYYRRGFMHRDPKQGPARIERNNSGTVNLIEGYYVNGKPFRNPAEGPDHIERNEDGRIEYELYSEVRPPRRPAGQNFRSLAGKKPSP
jgi:hypothetical protein